MIQNNKYILYWKLYNILVTNASFLLLSLAASRDTLNTNQKVYETHATNVSSVLLSLAALRDTLNTT